MCAAAAECFTTAALEGPTGEIWELMIRHTSQKLPLPNSPTLAQAVVKNYVAMA